LRVVIAGPSGSNNSVQTVYATSSGTTEAELRVVAGQPTELLDDMPEGIVIKQHHKLPRDITAWLVDDFGNVVDAADRNVDLSIRGGRVVSGASGEYSATKRRFRFPGVFVEVPKPDQYDLVLTSGRLTR